METEGLKNEIYDRSAMNNWCKKEIRPDDQRHSTTSFQGFKSNKNEVWRLDKDKNNQQNKCFISEQSVCNCNWRQKYHNENCAWRQRNFNN